MEKSGMINSRAASGADTGATSAGGTGAESGGGRMKIDVQYLEYLWPMRHFLVSCGELAKKSNIIAISFCMPVSKSPPLIACAIGSKTCSHDMIERSGEFIINVPTQDLKAKINYCGFHSGREVDKFKATGLTPLPARKLKAPIVAECVAHMECLVRQRIEAGDKDLFIAEVIEAYADEEIVKGERKVEYTLGDFPRKIYSTRLDLH